MDNFPDNFLWNLQGFSPVNLFKIPTVSRKIKNKEVF